MSRVEGMAGGDVTAGPEGRTEKLQMKIGGMSCSFCVASITKALGRMEGVRAASVNLAHEEALVAVRKLLALVPPTARVVREGREEELLIEQVQSASSWASRPGQASRWMARWWRAPQA